MVVTSCRCGTLPILSGSALRMAAHRIGRAAFLAPEMPTSPASGTPPSMINLSMCAARWGYLPAQSSGVQVSIDSAWISSRMRLPSAR